MTGPGYTRAVGEAHRASADLAWMEQAEPNAPGTVAFGMFVGQKHVDARNTVFKELGGEPYPPVIRGEAVIEGVEALLYATGQDAQVARTMAERLSKVVVPAARETVFIAAATTPYYLNNFVGHVGVNASDGVRLGAGPLSATPNPFHKFARIIVPYGGVDYFYEDSREPGWRTDPARRPTSQESVSADIQNLVIFDDPEEAATYNKANRYSSYLLVGMDAVSHMLRQRGSQDAIAVNNMLTAPEDDSSQPSLEGIDITEAIGSGLRSMIDLKHDLPAQSHVAIVGQTPYADLLEAMSNTIYAMPEEKVAASSRLTDVRLNRKLDAELGGIATTVIAEYLAYIEADDGIIESNAGPLAAALKRRYAQSMEAQLTHNHNYEHAIGPISRLMKRRRVSRIAAAHQD